MFTHSVEENGLGRAFCLWLLARELNWDVEIVAPQFGKPWLPLGEEQAFLSTFVSDPVGAAERSDLLLALKPWPGSFDLALKAGRAAGRPVTLDVDDPDWESVYGWNHRARARGLHQAEPARRLSRPGISLALAGVAHCARRRLQSFTSALVPGRKRDSSRPAPAAGR